MKKIIYSLLSILLCGLQSCVDLDMAPYNQVASGNMWSNAALTNQGVAGVYAKMRGWGVYSTSYSYNVVPFECLGMTGEAYRSIPYTSGTAGADNGFFSTMWKNLYEGVHRANDAIANLSEVGGGGVDEETRLRLLSESKFLRAYYYMRLNELYGRYGLGVPIYTEPLASVEDCTKGQSPESEVWDLIVQDLTDCINEPNLPGKYAQGNSSYGRITKGAAYAFRGYTYQFMGDYAKALADFEAIEGLGYALYSPSNGVKGNRDFFQLFKPANEQCDEMIFSVQCVETSGMGNPRGINYGNRCTGGSAWNNYLPNPAFVEMYECADGSEFDWEKYCPGWHSMTPQERVAFFLRDGLQSGKGEWGTTEATSNYQALYNNMVSYGADMSKYLDQGNEARIRQAYEDRDPRLMQSIITPYSTYDGNQAGVGNHTWTLRWPYILDAGEPYDIRTDTNSKFYYLWRKYVTENDECTTRWVYSEDIILCRYAEILLRRAECLNELGRTSEAVAFVNRIRQRVGHVLLNDQAYPATIVSGQEDMRQRIRKEFYVELGGEDSMFFNELRWGTWYDRKFKDHSSGQVGELNTNGLMQIWGETTYKHLSVGEQIKIWPIPAKEREMNSNLTQNPGWQD